VAASGGRRAVVGLTAGRMRPDAEMSCGTGDAVLANQNGTRTSRLRARVEATRSPACETCPSLGAVA
jgi:hypothetical protein